MTRAGATGLEAALLEASARDGTLVIRPVDAHLKLEALPAGRTPRAWRRQMVEMA